jgi:hypothetical protein
MVPAGQACEFSLNAILTKTGGIHARIVNQIVAMTIATTIAAHTAGVTFFELPLRGESLAAWLNSVFIAI